MTGIEITKQEIVLSPIYLKTGNSNQNYNVIYSNELNLISKGQ